jgi:hypothetical protein
LLHYPSQIIGHNHQARQTRKEFRNKVFEIYFWGELLDMFLNKPVNLAVPVRPHVTPLWINGFYRNLVLRHFKMYGPKFIQIISYYYFAPKSINQSIHPSIHFHLCKCVTRLKTPRVKIYKAIIFIFCECEMWSLTFREVLILQVFVNKVLNKIFESRKGNIYIYIYVGTSGYYS